MFWVIKTRFSIGLWLHDPAAEKGLHLEKAIILKYTEYEKAIKYVERESAGKISMNQFTPNRLYQIQDRHIYAVFFNRKYVAFIEIADCQPKRPPVPYLAASL